MPQPITKLITSTLKMLGADIKGSQSNNADGHVELWQASI